MEARRIFLLSPAKCSGKRAQFLLNEQATFDTAVALQQEGLPIGRVFTFMSGLYFRGKVAYVEAFAAPPAGMPGALVITPSRGLVPVDTPLKIEDIREFADVDIAAGDGRYSRPLERDAKRLAADLQSHSDGTTCEIVLLGSIATGKYVDILLENFGPQLRFPSEFVGRGDMSRGSLMLRHAADRQELNYIPVAGAIRRGRRPEKLPKRKYDTPQNATPK